DRTPIAGLVFPRPSTAPRFFWPWSIHLPPFPFDARNCSTGDSFRGESPLDRSAASGREQEPTAIVRKRTCDGTSATRDRSRRWLRSRPSRAWPTERNGRG